MFGRMQFVFDPPELLPVAGSRSAIRDFDGNTIGFLTSKRNGWFLEGSDGSRLCEIANNDTNRYSITDSSNCWRGWIHCPVPMSYGFGARSLNMFELFDSANRPVAHTDKFSYSAGWSFKKNYIITSLQKKELNLHGMDGSVVAIIHSSTRPNCCQVDFYRDVDQMLVLSLVAVILGFG
jgi:hypothetical protein